MISRGSFFSSLGLGLFVVASSWLAIDQSQIRQFFEKQNFQTGEGTDVTVTQMYPTGLRHYVAYAQHLTQFNNQNVNLHKIHITLYPQTDEPNWHLRADQGKVRDNQTQIHLIGNVVATRPGNTKYQPLKFKTPHITLFPKADQAKTDAPVTLTQPDSPNKITGIGLTATEKPQEIIRLLSDVHSTYQPATQKAVQSHTAGTAITQPHHTALRAAK